jgi:hypothetical protein
MALLALLVPGAALGNGDAPTGDEIAAALTGHDIVYGDVGWERHEADGRLLSRSTESRSGETSVGQWSMQGARRCLRWSDATDWVCYEVEIAGDRLRFIDEMGNTSTGRLVPR